jgi:hypothetical protein
MKSRARLIRENRYRMFLLLIFAARQAVRRGAARFFRSLQPFPPTRLTQIKQRRGGLF